MGSETHYWHECRAKIEAKLGWGSAHQWQSEDFEALAERIHAETGVRLSTSTLRRLWGRVKYDHLPAITTLNTLARFVGYTNWRTFRQAVAEPGPASSTEFKSIKPEASENASVDTVVPKPRRRGGRWLVWLGGLVLLGGLVSPFIYQRSAVAPPVATYTFSSQPVTRGIPNSVVFRYDATDAPTDSVYIQQSWDVRRRQLVPKSGHYYTSMYYYPGFYEAQLVVGKRTVKKHKLLIPSQGWLALIDQQPVPVYVPMQAVQHTDSLSVPVSLIQANHVRLQPHPPWVHYYRVGDLDSLTTHQFEFTTLLRNTYREGAAICQKSQIALLTEGSAITIPLASKGCVAELTLFSLGQQLSAQQANLSGFGVDFSDWVRVRCSGDGAFIYFYINDQLVYQLRAPTKPARIIGLAYGFQGTGSIRDVRLLAGNQVIYEAF